MPIILRLCIVLLILFTLLFSAIELILFIPIYLFTGKMFITASYVDELLKRIRKNLKNYE